MSKNKMNFCPWCGNRLNIVDIGGKDRSVCQDDRCGYVFWNNPTPVVAAIVEHNGNVILVRSHGWPEGWFGLVTGFLEQGEMPESAVLREVNEELGLNGKIGRYIGMYPFYEKNQFIIAYHVVADAGEIRLDEEELEGYREVPIEKVKPWPMGTGAALRDWLKMLGYEREFSKSPRL